MIDVLMLTNNDWSNTGWRFSKCLESLGLNVQFFKGNKHLFEYPEQGQIHSALAWHSQSFTPFLTVPELRPLVEAAKVIHFIASTLIQTGADLKKKNIVMQHGGSMYRQNHEVMNPVLNGFVDATIIQMPELMGLGAKNETWISFPVDTELLQLDFQIERRLRIGHFPSNTEVKGTEKILPIMEKSKSRFEYVGIQDLPSDHVTWAENLERIRGCDILIEACNLTQLGRTYGEWGNTVVEAAALGKIVITNSLSIDYYEREYGPCPLLIANSEEQLETRLEEVLAMTEAELIAKSEETREWVVQYHSMEATAMKLKDKVYNQFFDFNN